MSRAPCIKRCGGMAAPSSTSLSVSCRGSWSTCPARPMEGSCRCCGLCPVRRLAVAAEGPPGWLPHRLPARALGPGSGCRPGARRGGLSPAGPGAGMATTAFQPLESLDQLSLAQLAQRPAHRAAGHRVLGQAHLRRAGRAQRIGAISNTGGWVIGELPPDVLTGRPMGAARGNYRSLPGQMTLAPGRRRSAHNEPGDGAQRS
jgi:hypothetical protein